MRTKKLVRTIFFVWTIFLFGQKDINHQVEFRQLYLHISGSPKLGKENPLIFNYLHIYIASFPFQCLSTKVIDGSCKKKKAGH